MVYCFQQNRSLKEKNMTRIMRVICFTLLLAIMLPLALSCQKADKGDGSETTGQETVFEITKELLASYSVIVPDNASDEINNIAKSLCEKIKSLTGTELSMKSDFVAEGSDIYRETEYEILVGLVARTESKEAHANIKNKDAGYAVINKKIVLFGFTTDALEASFRHFNNDILYGRKNESALLTSESYKMVNGKYTYTELLINGTNAKDYTIVYPAVSSFDEISIAKALASDIALTSGLVLDVVSDKTAVSDKPEIWIGKVNRITDSQISERDQTGFVNGSAYVGVSNGSVWLFGNDRISITSAKNRFLELVSVNGDTANISIEKSKVFGILSASVKSMFYNVKYDLNDLARDPDAVVQTLIDASPDVLGTTEVTDAWLAKLKSELNGYECLSGKKSQQNSNGEYNAIFYNKDKFDVVSSGTKWLSATPDKSSMYSGARHYMIFNYAELCHKESGVKFMFIVAHFEPYRTSSTNPNHIVNPKADDVRIAQAKQLKAFVKEQSLPVVLVGDFNDSPSAKSIKELVSDQVVSYAMDIAKEQVGKGGTLISSDYTTRGSAIYDYVFVTAKIISVERYENMDNKVGGSYPSDHLPVAANLTIYN